ncbi:MAG: immunoglobulin domain-containing protein [Phycisphaerales bacterium]|nr:immunoglobulin domain-containing protein [Phycisphaerales bacterium]
MNKATWARWVISAAIACLAQVRSDGQCEPHWLPGVESLGPSAYIYAMTRWDPDGAAGPMPDQLVVAGTFYDPTGGPLDNIAMWDGTGWKPLGSGLDRTATDLTVFDPDGPGPRTPVLIVAGAFTQAGGVQTGGVAAWDGQSWSALSPGVPSIDALTCYDPDGAGPAPERLIAGGYFLSIGGVAANSIAAWNGETWAPLGGGVTGPLVGVSSLTTHDPDGSGPAPNQLIAGGLFRLAGSAIARNIAAWDGTTWSGFGAGFNNEIQVVSSFDPDGDGPANPQLIAGGFFTMSGMTPLNYIAAWNGAAWSALGTGVNKWVASLTSFDPDDAGPAGPLLIAGGLFSQAGGIPATAIAAWNGSSWSALGGGLGLSSAYVWSLRSFDPDLAGPRAPMLVAGGTFQTAGGQPSDSFARWAVDAAPWVAIQPESRTINSGGEAIILAVPARGYSDVAYQWIRNGINVVDGPGGASAGGGSVSGSSGQLPSPTIAAAASLTITGVRSADAGQYTVTFTNACGESTSVPAELIVRCNAADLNLDGHIDFMDYCEFLNLYAVQDERVDYVEDGFVEFVDYLEFLNLYDAGC